MDDGADQILVVFNGQRGAADEALDHRQVALVGNRGGEQLAEQRRSIEPFQLAAQSALQHPAELILVERFEHVAEQTGCARAKP